MLINLSDYGGPRGCRDRRSLEGAYRSEVPEEERVFHRVTRVDIERETILHV